MTSNDRPQDPSRPSQRTILLGTIVIASMANASLAAGRLIVPLIALSMGASIELVGLTAALFTAMPMLASVAFGRWVDRSGTISPLAFAAVLIILAGASAITFTSPFTLPVTAALVGTGAIFTHIVATRAVGEVGRREDRGRNLGLLVMVYSITQFLGPVISGWAFANVGMAAAMAVIGLPGLMILASLPTGMHNYKARKIKLAHGTARLRMRELIAMPNLRKWLIISSSYMAVITLFPFTVALQAVEIGITATSAGLVLGAFSCGVFVARIATPLITRHLRPRLAVHLSLLLGGCCYAVLPLTDQLATFAMTGFAIGLTLGVGGPLTLGLIYDAAPEPRVNEAIGISLAMSSFQQTILPLLIGLIAAHVGVTPVIFGVAFCLGCISIYTIVSKSG